jgi:hypothetical protein
MPFQQSENRSKVDAAQWGCLFSGHHYDQKEGVSPFKHFIIKN